MFCEFSFLQLYPYTPETVDIVIDVSIEFNATVANLLHNLNISDTAVYTIAVNNDAVTPEHTLKPNDVIRIFAPITGGS